MPEVTVTQSTIKDFERCKRRWWLRHFRGYDRERYGSAITVGNLVHDALADWYAGELENPIEFVTAKADAARMEFPSDAASIDKDEELAIIMLEGYLEWLEETGADYELEAIEPEREVEVELAPAIDDVRGRILLRGKIDGKVRRRDGWTAFLEHKTVGNFTDLSAISRMNQQLLTYELLDYLDHIQQLKDSVDETEKLPENAPPLVGGYILNMLRKVKRTARSNPPFYERDEGSHNLEQLRNHWKHVVSVAREMQERAARLERGEDHHVVAPPDVRSTCRWDCQFFDVCPLFDDGSDAESVLQLEYVKRDPLERYTELGQ